MAGVSMGESAVWEGVDGEWTSLFGSYEVQGVCLEWHDFNIREHLAWAESFHPGSLEICLNLTGQAVMGKSPAQVLEPGMVALYSADMLTEALRCGGQRHSFVTIEVGPDWLAKVFTENLEKLRPLVREFLKGKKSRNSLEFGRMNPWLVDWVQQIRHPPVPGAVVSVWYRSKVIEALAQLLYSPSEEFFCVRQKRICSERVEKVKKILQEKMEFPPTLAELGKMTGCSPFYLSRIFSQETGMTITRYLRKVRLEKAAEYLRSGKYNVTEAAMAVGYSSLSHFSKAFSRTYGRCPCTFSLSSK